MTDGRYVALLRGINVGRNKRIGMADLRAALAGAGFAEVRTVLQSGNVVLRVDGRGTGTGPTAAQVAAGVERVVLESFGYDVRVMVRTAEDLARVVAESPLPDPEDGSRFLVAFLSAAPDPGAFREPELPEGSRERWWPRGAEVYVWCPDGLQNSPIMDHFGRHSLDVDVTVRNWNTVTKLAALATSPG
jgi:uncharacterized protein (DUF1697 family)